MRKGLLYGYIITLCYKAEDVPECSSFQEPSLGLNDNQSS